MKKGLMILLCIAMAGMVLSGCAARNASGTTATAAPIVTNSPMATNSPNTAASPDMSPEANMGTTAGTQAGTGMMGGTTGTTNTTDTMDNGMMAGANNASGMTPAQADRLAERVEEAVERISEIDDAEAVIDTDNRVLIAVEFDEQYSAGLDDRMKEMIIQAVQKVDDGLTEIEITDDDTLYGQVKSLGERLTRATGLDELADDFGDLWDRITGM
ncbi:MAG: YhcN/YlaJ family sporulation lipoprotein [Clostridia bacterium]|nr:YhcN/YlaJ family sporulation lipoprotein [Clostridia bacterium]